MTFNVGALQNIIIGHKQTSPRKVYELLKPSQLILISKDFIKTLWELHGEG